MKSASSVTSWILLMVLATPGGYALAQSRKNSYHFPTYEEIRGNRKEIVDFVAPRALGNDYEPVISKTITLDKYWNAFNYLADSTVYYLNGKQVKSQKMAKKELDERSAEIERVSIGAVELNGKREIEIDYRVKSKTK